MLQSCSVAFQLSYGLRNESRVGSECETSTDSLVVTDMNFVDGAVNF